MIARPLQPERRRQTSAKITRTRPAPGSSRADRTRHLSHRKILVHAAARGHGTRGDRGSQKSRPLKPDSRIAAAPAREGPRARLPPDNRAEHEGANKKQYHVGAARTLSGWRLISAASEKVKLRWRRQQTAPVRFPGVRPCHQPQRANNRDSHDNPAGPEELPDEAFVPEVPTPLSGVAPRRRNNRD